MSHELRSSIRTWVRRPFYPVVAVVILALGLASGISVFTYINSFFDPFPGVDSRRLVRVSGVTTEEPYQDISYLDFQDYAAASTSFDGLAATQPYFAASVRHEAFTEVAFLEAVSGEYFSVLGLRTQLGRGIARADDRPGAEPVAVLSHAWWRRSFQADPGVIGRTVYLNFRPFTIVGVMPPDFVGTVSDFRPDVWIPIAPFKDRYVGWARRAENRDLPLVRVFGRLAPGASRESAASELEALAAGLDEAHSRATERRGVRLDAATWIDPRTRLAEWDLVRLMIAAAGGLLLLVCANVANVLLSVASRRQHELTMRAALGASPRRLMVQMLFESLVLSTIAGAIALAIAVPASTRLGSYFARPSVWGANVAREIGIDWKVVLFALAISMVTGLVAGLLPAIRASRQDLAGALKVDRGSGAPAVRRIGPVRLPTLHDLLVTVQVGLAVVLLVVAGLVLRTLGTVQKLDPGFETNRLVVTHISTSSTTLKPEERDHFFRELARRLNDESWVRSATIADYPLLSPHASAEFLVEGRSKPARLVFSQVIPGFFEALGIDVVRGRAFTENDDAGAPDVAVVNQKFADRFFPEGKAVGRRLWRQEAEDGKARGYEIVGVVRDTKTQDIFADVEPTVYFSYRQHRQPTGNALLVNTNMDPRAAVPQLSRWLRDFESHLAIINVVTYADVMKGNLYTQRMNAELFSVLAFLGLVLAAVGIFSVMSLAVERRFHEIGVRMSLGARRADIGRLVVARAMIPVTIGLSAGLLVSLAVTVLVRSLLYGVEPSDPVAMLAGAFVLVVAALMATWIPAHHATRVDPAVALRHE